jgi:hypothetical protein
MEERYLGIQIYRVSLSRLISIFKTFLILYKTVLY